MGANEGFLPLRPESAQAHMTSMTAVIKVQKPRPISLRNYTKMPIINDFSWLRLRAHNVWPIESHVAAQHIVCF